MVFNLVHTNYNLDSFSKQLPIKCFVPNGKNTYINHYKGYFLLDVALDMCKNKCSYNRDSRKGEIIAPYKLKRSYSSNNQDSPWTRHVIPSNLHQLIRKDDEELPALER